MEFKLSELTYDLNALESYISKMTLELHNGMRNQTNITNLNSRTNGKII
jgi:superoxide dismutase